MKSAISLKQWAVALVLVASLSALVAWHQQSSRRASNAYATVTLLIPDEMPEDTAEVRIWVEAANERGVLLQPLHTSDWVRGVNYGAAASRQAIIVPDTFHRQMSDVAVQTIYQVVEAGGSAMIVQDGGLLNEKGSYQAGPARFARMLGVRYGDYAAQKEDLSYYDEIRGAPATMELLGLPPGRYLDASAAAKLTSIDAADLTRLDRSFSTFVAGYTKDSQRFAVLKTDRPTLKGILLESSNGDIVASVQPFGKGQAMFVNLPLTYLVERTDGIFLHGFLSYFASHIAMQPMLLASPNGIGSLILNWHNDDGKAIGLLRTLQDAGIFDHGHQSMHFTAGPDVNQEGDGLGMDLDHNENARNMIRLLREQGHTIGNHGGWIHNYFGDNANDNNGDDFVQFLDMNNASVTQANGGQEPKEYSAPLGNQPLWVYDWLESHGVKAYYISGSVGMPPTRLWIGKRQMGKAWAFPVMTYGQVASAEEASFQKMPVAEFNGWLQQVARFVEQPGVMRLSYFHPIGAVMYLPAVKAYVETVRRCTDQGRCQFLSMTEAADFLNQREQVVWSMRLDGDSDLLSASHPQSLEAMAWSIPKSRYAGVRIAEGSAAIEETSSAWLVRAQSGKQITLQLRHASSAP